MVLYDVFVLSWGLTIIQNSIRTILDLDRSRLTDTRSGSKCQYRSRYQYTEYRIDASPSLREAESLRSKDGQRLSNLWKCVKRLWNTLKTTFFNVKLQRLCKSHHLQCMTSSKDSEKLEKSLCIRVKAEDLCWMPMVFGPSDNSASLIGMILSLTLLNGPRNTSRNHCW